MQLQHIVPKEQGDPMRCDGWPIKCLRSPDVGETALEFGRFHLLPRRRQLLADGVPVELGTRASDLLMVLVEADGMLVTKDELFARIWPGIVVEESNLKVQVCALRKALGENRDFIRTESGRGYRFTAAIRSTAAVPTHWSTAAATEAPAARKAAASPDLAAIVSRLAYLEAKLADAVNLLANPRIASERNAFRFPQCMASSSRPARSCKLRDRAAPTE